MMKFIEMTGKNEDEAVANALRQLGGDRDDVSVEIIERAKSGFLGIGSSPARVRVSYEVADEVVEELGLVLRKCRKKLPAAHLLRKQLLLRKRKHLRLLPLAMSRSMMKSPSRSVPS